MKLKRELFETLLFLLSLLFFSVSIAPTISWGDSAELAIRLFDPNAFEWENTPREYPLYEALGRAFSAIPIGDYGLRANLLSSFFGAFATLLVFRMVRTYTNSYGAGILAYGTLMVSHTFWLLSAVAEVYTLGVTITLLSVSSLFAWLRNQNPSSAAKLSFILGLNIIHHEIGLVLVFWHLTYLAIFCRKYIDKKITFALLFPLLVMTSGSPWFQGIIQNMQRGESILNVLPRSPSSFMHQSDVSREFVLFGLYLGYNFPLLPIALIFLLKRRYLFLQFLKSPFFVLFGFSTMVFIAGIASSIQDKYNMYVVGYPIVSIIIGVCSVGFVEKLKNKVSVLFTILLLIFVNPLIYFATWKASDYFQINLSQARYLEGRINNKYFLWPPKRSDFSPRLKAIEKLNNTPPGAVILADYTIFTTLKYIQITEKRFVSAEVVLVELIPNLNLDSYARELILREKRRLFLSAIEPRTYYYLDSLSAEFKLLKRGSVYEVIHSP